MPSKDLSYYLERFYELRVRQHSKHGEAHYKPILLLSIIDLVMQGIITENKIIVSGELIETFNNYWNLLGNSNYKGGLNYPFMHIQSDGFWHIVFKQSFSGLQPKTINKLREAVDYAYLDNELFNLLQDSSTISKIADSLIDSWFSSKKEEIKNIIQISDDFQEQTLKDIENFDKIPQEEPRYILKKSLIRNTFFRKAVIHVYDYRCAFCGLKVVQSPKQYLVDGAHIKPFAKFFDSKIDNGISFCKNHHWAFDLGWFSIDDNYRILISKDLQEESPNAKTMKEYEGQNILIPNQGYCLPRIEALRWHRENRFRT